jgi:hypothetical protein
MVQKMNHSGFKKVLTGAILFLLLQETNAQVNNDSTALTCFFRKELNTGIAFSLHPEREELRTDELRNFEELSRTFFGFRFDNRNWNYLPCRQESWSYLIEAGPFAGKGDLLDSSEVRLIDANQKQAGLLGHLGASYSVRLYFDRNHYTLVSVNAWARYDLFRQSAAGTVTDSVSIKAAYDEKSGRSKFRNGIRAKAGWGKGRLDPVNHSMAAAWLLKKYYPGRIFSQEEIEKVTREMGRIKHNRNARTGHSTEKELKQLEAFLNKELLLIPPKEALRDWEMTEFRPRFKGSRLEIGPFFNYFNREPDLVYGGYFSFENHKYCRLKWNRTLKASLSYNGYKKEDWILLETALGWNWYPGLKTEYGFGVKYIPGMMFKDFDDTGPVRHNFIPYLEYFTQISSKYRIETMLAWRIAPNDQFMLPGPEVSVSIYKSRY